MRQSSDQFTKWDGACWWVLSWLVTYCTHTFCGFIWLMTVEIILYTSQVKEDAGETRKKRFVNLKRVIWHEGFKQVLESIIEYSKTGYWTVCGNNICRWLFPLILILSADYKEQWVDHEGYNKPIYIWHLIQMLHGFNPWNKQLISLSHMPRLWRLTLGFITTNKTS